MPDMKGETVCNLIHMNTTSTEQAAWFRTMKNKKQKKKKTDLYLWSRQTEIKEV